MVSSKLSMKGLITNVLFAVPWTLSTMCAEISAGPLPAISASRFAPEAVTAQPPAVILRLKGIGSGDASADAKDLQVAAGVAYVASSGGLEIYSVTNPSAPAWVGGYKASATANAIAVVGRYAYLAEGTARTLTNDPGALEIIDVVDPANPMRLGRIETLGRANDVRIAGNMAYVAESLHWTGSNLLGSLEIFDVSTPAKAVRKATFNTAGSATSVDVSGSYAYLADGVIDLQVLDVSDPGNPQQVGMYLSDVVHNACGFEPGGPGTRVQVANGLAYSAGDNGLHILDISDPTHPISISDNFCSPVYAIYVAGQHAYIPVWHSIESTFFLLIDEISNPGNLVGVGMKKDWRPSGMQVEGNLLYLAAVPLEVYEISNRPAITHLSIALDSLVVAWDYAPGFVLQRAITPAEPLWKDVPGSGEVNGLRGMNLVPSGANEFFRLVRP